MYMFLYIEEFLLEDFSKYVYMTNGQITNPGIDDSAEFRSLVESMAIMAFSPDDQSGK